MTIRAAPRFFVPWRLLWLLPPVLLGVPLVLNWPWSNGDFVLAIAMFGTAGGLIELAAWASRSCAYRWAAILAVMAAFLTVWINGAAGILGEEGNPANLMFLAVIVLVAAGALLSGFKALGMARTMAAAASAHIAACIVGFGAGLGAPGAAGLREALLAIVLFAPLWGGSAALFARAALASVPDPRHPRHRANHPGGEQSGL